MTTRTALFALLAMWGVGLSGTTPLRADELTPDDVMPSPSIDASLPEANLINRVWVQTGEGDTPGITRIFLSDGTLISDNVWEAHRLSRWTMTSDTGLAWTEDRKALSVEIAALGPDSLTLVFHRRGGDKVERYTALPMPGAGTG